MPAGADHAREEFGLAVELVPSPKAIIPFHPLYQPTAKRANHFPFTYLCSLYVFGDIEFASLSPSLWDEDRMPSLGRGTCVPYKA